MNDREVKIFLFEFFFFFFMTKSVSHSSSLPKGNTDIIARMDESFRWDTTIVRAISSDMSFFDEKHIFAGTRETERDRESTRSGSDNYRVKYF